LSARWCSLPARRSGRRGTDPNGAALAGLGRTSAAAALA
jgi:hypothetical protein